MTPGDRFIRALVLLDLFVERMRTRTDPIPLDVEMLNALETRGGEGSLGTYLAECLVERGLLEAWGDGYYRLTDEGVSYPRCAAAAVVAAPSDEAEGARRVRVLRTYLRELREWGHRQLLDTGFPKDPRVEQLREHLLHATDEVICFARDASVFAHWIVPGRAVPSEEAGGATDARRLNPFLNVFYQPGVLLEGVVDQVQRAIAFYEKNPQFTPRSATAMNNKLTELQQRDADRLRVLDALYELSEGRPSPHTAVSFDAVFERAGVSYEVGNLARLYLEQEGLVVGHTSHRLAITHEGIKEREAAIRGRGRAGTDHFAQPVVNHVVQHFNAPVYGTVQTGDHNTAHVKNVAGAQVADLAQLLDQLHAQAGELPPGHRANAIDVVAKIKEETGKENPNTLLLDAYVKTLSTFVTLAPTVNAVLSLIAGAGV